MAGVIQSAPTAVALILDTFFETRNIDSILWAFDEVTGVTMGGEDTHAAGDALPSVKQKTLQREA